MAGGSDGETRGREETNSDHGGMLHVCGPTGRGVSCLVGSQRPLWHITNIPPGANFTVHARLEGGRGEGNRDVETGPVRDGAKAVEPGYTTHARDPSTMTGALVVSCLAIRDKGLFAFASPVHAVFPLC